MHFMISKENLPGRHFKISVWILSVLLTTLLTCRADNWQKPYLPEDTAWQETKQEFVFNSGPEPETLDPHLVTSSDSFRLVKACFEGLTENDPKTLIPRPALAKSWTVSENGLIYTFKLCEAKWSDGQTITATDIVHSWERALTPATAAPYANLFFHIKGAKTFYENPAKQNFTETVAVSAENPTTLKVQLTASCSFFPDLLAMPVFYPVRTDITEKHKGRWTRPETIITNGAFLLKERLPREKIIFSKNPLYRDADIVKLEKLTALIIDDLNTACKQYQSGGIHWLPSLPHPRIEELKRHPDFYVHPYFGTYFYRFNVTKPPFDDARVRRAFSLATDRKEITDNLLKNGQLPVSTFCPAVAGYEPPENRKYNVLKARNLLEQAGFGKNGKPFPVVELTYNTDEGHKQIAEAIAGQWKRNLGIEILTANSEWKVFLAEMKALNYTICRSSWIGDYNDPTTFFDLFSSNSGNNRTGWKNKTYDTLLKEARNAASQEKRNKLFRKMENLLTEDECPVLPIYRYVNTGLLHESVLGWFPNVRNEHPFKYMWLEDF